jgi:hypothetical protein
MPFTADDVMDKANAIRTAAEQDATRIGNNGDLTRLARQQRLAKSHLAARAQMDTLKQTATADTTSRVADLKRKLFGVGDLPGDAATNAISSRDALDRVNGVTDPMDALKILDRANSIGDEVLARAVACHAFEMFEQLDLNIGGGWVGVLQSYVNGRPDSIGNAVQELLDLSTRTFNSVDLWGFSLPTPLDLAGLSDPALQQLASA